MSNPTKNNIQSFKAEVARRIEALSTFLGCDTDNVTPCKYDALKFEACGGEYLVLTDLEADSKTDEYIRETLWAFNASFIASHSTHGWSDRCIKALEKMQGELCEDANPIVAALIEDMDKFIKDAICEDGRGHFLAFYDSCENESGAYFIYRTN